MTEKDGYVDLTGLWKDGDCIDLDFPMEVHMLASDTRVREDIGKVAFTRGPITFCMEEADNGRNLHLCRVDKSRIQVGDKWNVSVEMSKELGHNMAVLKVPGLRQEESPMQQENLYTEYRPMKETKTELTLVPYYAWNNRGEGEMSVWIRI